MALIDAAKHALVFTDIVDSTVIVGRVGDREAARLWAGHDRLARELLVTHGGREIDRSDGFFLLFDDADGAARFALGYHAALAPLGLAARVGLHVGSVALRENPHEAVARGAKPIEVEGLAKPLAARIMSLARGGQTLLSDAARQALGEALSGTSLQAHGHYRLKGLEEPHALFELGTEGAAFTPPADTEKGYCVVRDAELWRPRREVPHNLAPERDSFIGRNTELRRLAQRLESGARLVAVLGVGGTGKTRLVRRYGLAWLGEWPGGVYFCDLSEARSFEGICFAVASALEVSLGKDDPVVQLGHAIAGRGRCLVILDNFEQVVEHARATLGRWLDRTGEAAFVATTRERLHLPGEEVMAIEPLQVDSEAIELFAARAKSQCSEFVLDDATRAPVAEVVKLLDGLPLAIELAAARIRVLSPAQIVERLRDRFVLLAGARGAAARQATLRAAIDWSWELLAPWEQAALAQCSVFEGGFTLEAAEAVLDLSACSEAPPAMDVVQALVDKSLVRWWLPKVGTRLDIAEPYFGMYLSIHEYAAQRLVQSGDTAARHAQQRHGLRFASLGTEEAIDALSLAGGVARRHALALDLDNLVVGCRRACARGDHGQAVPCVVAVWEVLRLQGPFSLGVELGTRVLDIDGLAGIARAEALLVRASANRFGGRASEGGDWIDEALALARQAGSRGLEARALLALADLYRRRGEASHATAVCIQALALDEAIGHRFGAGNDLLLLGLLYQEQGHYAQARNCDARAQEIFRNLGDRRSEGLAFGNLGVVLHMQGEMEQARAAYEQAIAIHREAGNRAEEGVSQGNLADLTCDQGLLEQGLQDYRRALALHRDVGNRHFEARVLANLAATYQELDRLDEALVHYEHALAFIRQIDDQMLLGSLQGNLGMLHQAQGRPGEARRNFDEALAHHRNRGERRGEGAVLGSLGLLWAESGDLEAARRSLQQGESLLREVGDPLALAKLLCKRGFAEARIGTQAAAHAALDSAASIAAQLRVTPGSELQREIVRLRSVLTASGEPGRNGPS